MQDQRHSESYKPVVGCTAQGIAVGDELERLYALHDKSLTEDRKGYLIEELRLSGIPIKAIIAGIRSLVETDVKNLKYLTILDAARKYVVGGPVDHFGDCNICGTEGFVVMRDGEGYTTAYPCTCERGKSHAKNQNLVQWNGKRIMMSSGRVRTLIHPDPVSIGLSNDALELVGSTRWEE
jgi:hypothetical protein